jgi:hypothetical protein
VVPLREAAQDDRCGVDLALWTGLLIDLLLMQ